MSKKNGFSMLEAITPMVRLLPPARLRAWRFGWYFSSSMALTTRARVVLLRSEKERVFHVGGDHTNGAAFAPRQAAGMEVRMVFQFLDGFDDPGTGRAFDYACIIKHPRDRGGGNLGPPGYLFEIHGYCLYCTRVKSLLGPTMLQMSRRVALETFDDSAYITPPLPSEGVSMSRMNRVAGTTAAVER